MIRRLRSQHQGRNYQNNIEGQYRGFRSTAQKSRDKQSFPPEWKSGLCCCKSISAKLQLIWNHCGQFKMLGQQAHWIGLSIKTYRIKADEKLPNSMVLRPWRRKMIKLCSSNPLLFRKSKSPVNVGRERTWPERCHSREACSLKVKQLQSKSS